MRDSQDTTFYPSEGDAKREDEASRDVFGIGVRKPCVMNRIKTSLGGNIYM